MLFSGQRRSRLRWAGLIGILMVIGCALGSGALVGAETSPESTREATPMPGAIVDDVRLVLLDWSVSPTGDLFTATLLVENLGARPISLPEQAELVVRESGQPEQRQKLAIAPGPGCVVAPDAQMRFALSGAISPTATPSVVIVGIIETDRSGARVEFPLNGNGASAFGGTGSAGSPQPVLQSPVATTEPGNATAVATPSICGTD